MNEITGRLKEANTRRYLSGVARIVVRVGVDRAVGVKERMRVQVERRIKRAFRRRGARGIRVSGRGASIGGNSDVMSRVKRFRIRHHCIIVRLIVGERDELELFWFVGGRVLSINYELSFHCHYDEDEYALAGDKKRDC